MLNLLLPLIAAASITHAPALTPGAFSRAEPALRVILSTRGDNKVLIADPVTLQTLTTIDAALGAHELAASRDNLLAIGSAYGGPGQGHNPPDNRLCIIDLAAGTLKHTVTIPDAKRPNDIAFLADSHTAAVTVEMPPQLILVDADKGVVTDRITLAHPAGHMLAVSPDGATAYVAHVMAGLISVVDLPARKVLTTIATATGAEGLALSPDGSRLWVANNRSNSISIIDTAARTVVETLPVDGFPFRMRFSPDGAVVAVSCPASQDIAIFDAASHDIITRVALAAEGAPPPQPTSLAFAADNLVVVCGGAQQLVRISTADWKVQTRTPTGPIPDALTAFQTAQEPDNAAPRPRD